jgi:hypothetical protein
MVAINFAFRAHLLWGVLCVFFTIISMMIVFDSYKFKGETQYKLGILKDKKYKLKEEIYYG